MSILMNTDIAEFVVHHRKDTGTQGVWARIEGRDGRLRRALGHREVRSETVDD
jgi:hypothetical protein